MKGVVFYVRGGEGHNYYIARSDVNLPCAAVPHNLSVAGYLLCIITDTTTKEEGRITLLTCYLRASSAQNALRILPAVLHISLHTFCQ